MQSFVSNVFIWSLIPAIFAILVLVFMVGYTSNSSLMKTFIFMYLGMLAINTFSQKILMNRYSTKYGAEKEISPIVQGQGEDSDDDSDSSSESSFGGDEVQGAAEDHILSQNFLNN